jgi:transcriptional regulator with XRE-family HTH domain
MSDETAPGAEALVTGTRNEIAQVGKDPRIEQAEAALDRFEQTGALRDASAYARSCYSVVREAVMRSFPQAVRETALQYGSAKVLDASTAAGVEERDGWLAWSLAHELRDLAASYGVPVHPIRAPRPSQRRARTAPLPPERIRTLAGEVFRVSATTAYLDEIMNTLGLSTAEVARIFGVSRQAVDQWRDNGVPSERAADLERVRDVARVLYQELIPERIPQVVRNKARGLDGRSILETLAEPEGPARVRAYLARLYSFEGA